MSFSVQISFNFFSEIYLNGFMRGNFFVYLQIQMHTKLIACFLSKLMDQTGSYFISGVRAGRDGLSSVMK